ncbi:MAG: exodeoxyribonuclease VII small subunit [Candidatus Dasytiphilus stammeri]
MSEHENKNVSFESSIQQLEQIVSYLEKGDLSLEEAINAFEKGIKLAKISQETLQNAEQRVQILLKNETLSNFININTMDKKE